MNSKLIPAQRLQKVLANAPVRDGMIKASTPQPTLRAGWAEDAQRLAAAGSDALVWPQLANEGDAGLSW